MSPTEGIVIASGLAVGYWFVSVFLTNARRDGAGPPVNGPSAGVRDEAVQAQSAASDPTWNSVLGVSPDADRSRITAAYRALVTQYHPDRVATMGPEIRATAEEMTARINRAYDEGLRRR